MQPAASVFFHVFPALVFGHTNENNIHACIYPSLEEDRLPKAFAEQNLIPEPTSHSKICLLIVSFNKEARLPYIYFAVKSLLDTAANEY